MENLPVIASTVSAKHIGLFLKEKYGLNSEPQCKLFRTGINHSYIVTAHDRQYVFRLYSFNWRSKQEVFEEVRLLTLLKEKGIAVSYPIQDSRGSYVQEVQAPEGLRYGVLFSYANGGKIRHFSDQTSHTIGTLMARLHCVTENLYLERMTYDAHTLTALPYQYAKDFFSESSGEMQFIKKAGDIVAQVYANANQSNLRTGAVHLDMWYDNMHVDGETDITIFDFDFCGNGWLLHDIAYFIMQQFHVEPDKVKYEQRLAAFFAGYESVTAISEEEMKMLIYSGLSIWIFYIGVQAKRFDTWSNIFLTENYLKRYIGMAKEWLAYNELEL